MKDGTIRDEGAARRLLVTGGRGFVAGSVMAQASGAWEVHAVSRGETLTGGAGLIWHTLDLCSAERLRAVFRDVKPHAVVHAAALADIDFCEVHRAMAEAVNVNVTRELARLCREGDAKMVFLSTDTVFDGKRGHYREEDPPGPLNVYAETKVRAEEAVAAEAERGVVARVALVVGLPVLGSGNSFLSRMVQSFEAGREVGVPANEIRSPIDVITLGRALVELAGNPFAGVIHLGGNDRLDWFTMVRQIAERLGHPPELVVANDPRGIPGRAARPLDASLDNTKARAVLDTPLCGLAEGLELVLEADT